MGIFGFLSKAHIDQTITSGDNTLLIEQLDQRIEREQKRVDDANLVISQLDNAVQTLIDYDRIRGDDGAIAVREEQKNERDNLNSIIDSSYAAITELQSDRLELSKEQLSIEAEVGPIRYIAELVYDGDPSVDILDDAVRYVILIIIFVFDPLAVLLLVAANISLKEARSKITSKKVAAVVDDELEWVEQDVWVDDDIDISSPDLERVRALLKKYRDTGKGGKKSSFIHNKIKKLERLEKELESKL